MEDARREPLPPRVARAALVVLVLVLALDLLARGVLPAFSWSGGDFANFYTASRVVLERQPLEPAYLDFTWFQRRIDEAGFNGQLGGFIPHPPSAAILFLPLARLDPLSAKRVWTALNIGLAALCIFLLAKTSGLDPWLASLILLLTGAGLRNDFLFGQLYLPLLASILGALRLHQKGRPVAAGLLLGSLVPVKYAGLPWFFYFVWKKRWVAAFSTAVTAIAVVSLTVWWVGLEPFQVFLSDVFPRHLAGEIQDPFATRLQSWASLFRRLCLAEGTLNPHPLVDAPALFFFSKSLVFCCLLALSTFVLLRARFPVQRHTELFHWGWIALSLMLVSPGGATYHFLLLTAPTAFFAAILIDDGRPLAAGLVVTLFGILNLPHYHWLEGMADGWATPLAYSRLFFLLLFYLAVIGLFRSRLDLRAPGPLWVVPPLMAAGLMSWNEFRAYQDPNVDGARLLVLAGQELKDRGGLIRTDPDFGSRRLVFCSMTRDPDGYAVFDDAGGLVATATERNFYRPDLAGDDSELLVEGVSHGVSKIWFKSGGDSPPQALVDGTGPKWSPDMKSFLFEREGRIHVREFDSGRERILPIDGRANDATFLADGNSVAYCVAGGLESLRVMDLASDAETVLLSSPDRISSPSGSPSGKGLLFTWNRDGNRDVWAIVIATRELIRVTTHRADDDDAVWDRRHHRVVFASDRGRGLGYTTLYWVPAPARLQD